MPELTTLSPLSLCHAEDAFSAAAGELRYAASQLERACIAMRGDRLAIAEDAIHRYLEGMQRGFAAIDELNRESLTTIMSSGE